MKRREFVNTSFIGALTVAAAHGLERSVGDKEFKQAAGLASAGKAKEAIAAFEKLRTEYRDSWIDRVSQERLAKLGESQEQNASEATAKQTAIQSPVVKPGLASQYPGDDGIEKHPAVLFADNFGTGEMKKWDEQRGSIVLSEDRPNAGRWCVHMPIDRIPPSLCEVLDNAGDRGDPQMVLLRLKLGVRQPADLETALNFVRDDDQSAQARRSDFIKDLGQSGQSDAVPVLLDVLRTSRQHSVQHEVLSALQLFDEPQIGRKLLAAYPRLPKDKGVRSLALDILSNRKVWANELARAVAAKTVFQADIKPELVERPKLHHDTELDRNIQNLWGATRLSPEEKQQRMATVAKILASGKGDSVRGKAIYTTACGKCHLLFGEGQKMGPDLTGYERDNLDFILVATIDPSAGIREKYTNYQIETTDGLLLSGYILEQTLQSVTIEDGQQSKVVVPRDEIETLRESAISRMPDGLLDAMSDEQVRDLFAYLQSRGPVANRQQEMVPKKQFT